MPVLKKIRSWSVYKDSYHRQRRRAVLVGIAAGVVALVFQVALSAAESLRVTLLDYLHRTHPVWGFAGICGVAAVLGALAAWITARFAPEAHGSGIPHVKGVLMQARRMAWKRLLPVKFIGGLLAIGSGFSLGREGPTVQMGAAVGAAIGELLKVSPKARPRLIAGGAGAGLAAAFHAPLAGFIFTIEELQREMSTLTYSVALIACVLSEVVVSLLPGEATEFHQVGFPAAPIISLPIIALVGVIAGVAGVAFNWGILWSQRLAHAHISLPTPIRAAIAGILVGIVAWRLPAAVGGGHAIIAQILDGQYAQPSAYKFLIALFAGKFCLTLLCYYAGVPGGIFGPMLVLGAAAGLLTGVGANSLIPALAPIPASFSVIGMAAFFAAVVRAPLTGIVLIVEMTGDYNQLLGLLTASMIAYLLSERLRAKPIYDALLAYDLEQKQTTPAASSEPMLMEFVIQEGSLMDGKSVRELHMPEKCLLVTVKRHGRDIVPKGSTIFQAGDHVTALVHDDNPGEAFAEFLTLSKE